MLKITIGIKDMAAISMGHKHSMVSRELISTLVWERAPKLLILIMRLIEREVMNPLI